MIKEKEDQYSINHLAVYTMTPAHVYPCEIENKYHEVCVCCQLCVR